MFITRNNDDPILVTGRHVYSLKVFLEFRVAYKSVELTLNQHAMSHTFRCSLVLCLYIVMSISHTDVFKFIIINELLIM